MPLIRFVFRVLATFALAVGVIMAVLDATRSIAADEIVMMPLGQSWQSISPETLAAFESMLADLGPFQLDRALDVVLAQPGFVVFAVLAILFAALGRRPARRVGRFIVES